MFIKSPVSPETFFITEGKQENEKRKLQQAKARRLMRACEIDARKSSAPNSAHGKEAESAKMKLPNAERAIVPIRKITHYLLSTS